MFSRNNKHYRPVPRSVSEAFGPYHTFKELRRRTRMDVIRIALGVIALGVVYGFLFAS